MPAEAGDLPGCTPLRRRLPAVLWKEDYSFECVRQVSAGLWKEDYSFECVRQVPAGLWIGSYSLNNKIYQSACGTVYSRASLELDLQRAGAAV